MNTYKNKYNDGEDTIIKYNTALSSTMKMQMCFNYVVSNLNGSRLDKDIEKYVKMLPIVYPEFCTVKTPIEYITVFRRSSNNNINDIFNSIKWLIHPSFAGKSYQDLESVLPPKTFNLLQNAIISGLNANIETDSLGNKGTVEISTARILSYPWIVDNKEFKKYVVGTNLLSSDTQNVYSFTFGIDSVKQTRTNPFPLITIK